MSTTFLSGDRHWQRPSARLRIGPSVAGTKLSVRSPSGANRRCSARMRFAGAENARIQSSCQARLAPPHVPCRKQRPLCGGARAAMYRVRDQRELKAEVPPGSTARNARPQEGMACTTDSRASARAPSCGTPSKPCRTRARRAKLIAPRPRSNARYWRRQPRGSKWTRRPSPRPLGCFERLMTTARLASRFAIRR